MDITTPADIKFLREQVVSRTAGVVTNGPGCSVAGDSLLAEIHCCQRFTKMTNSRVLDTVIYLYTHSSVILSDKCVAQLNLFGRRWFSMAVRLVDNLQTVGYLKRIAMQYINLSETKREVWANSLEPPAYGLAINTCVVMPHLTVSHGIILLCLLCQHQGMWGYICRVALVESSKPLVTLSISVCRACCLLSSM